MIIKVRSCVGFKTRAESKLKSYPSLTLKISLRSHNPIYKNRTKIRSSLLKKLTFLLERI